MSHHDRFRPLHGLGEKDAVEISDPHQIKRLIGELKERRVLITVALPDVPDLYNSAVLDVDGAQRQLVLDELTPSPGHERLLNSRELMVYARLDGLSVRFQSALVSHAHENGIALYHVELPERLYHGQKRSYYRVRVGLGVRLPVIVEREDQPTIDGELRDLSVGGVGMAFAPQTRIQQGEHLSNCVIDLPDGGTLSCSLEVRYASVDENHQELRIGARFANLTPAQERSVQRCVHDLEREHIRRQTREGRL